MAEPVAFIHIQLSELELENFILKAVKKAISENSKSTVEITTNYLTRDEARKKLRITFPTLKKYTDSGQLIKYNIGGRMLYSEAQVNQAITSIKKYSHN